MMLYMFLEASRKLVENGICTGCIIMESRELEFYRTFQCAHALMQRSIVSIIHRTGDIPSVDFVLMPL